MSLHVAEGAVVVNAINVIYALVDWHRHVQKCA